MHRSLETLEPPPTDGMVSPNPSTISDPEMTKETDKPATGTRDTRQDRLASALRENLKRRKVQARERSKPAEPSRNDDATPHEGTSGKTGD